MFSFKKDCLNCLNIVAKNFGCYSDGNGKENDLMDLMVGCSGEE